MAEDRESWREAAEAAETRAAGWLATLFPVAPTADSDEPDAVRGTDPDFLRGVREDADGLAFTRRLLESVVGAGDPFVAALGLRSLSRELPSSLPLRDRVAMKVGGVASLALPWAVLPIARRMLRDRVAHLALSAKLPEGSYTESKLDELRAALRGRAEAGMTAALALGGDPVLGPQSVSREVHRLQALAVLPEVTHLIVDPARLAPATLSGAWTLDDDAVSGCAQLVRVLETAQQHGVTVLLEPRDYRGAVLAAQMVAAALEDASVRQASFGLTLAAELPESFGWAERLISLARARVQAGGAPLELGVGVLGFAGREQVQSIVSGLAVPALDTRVERSAQLLRVCELLLEAAGASGAIRVSVASEDPHLLAAATLRAEAHGTSLTVQLRSGTAPTLAATLVAHDQAVRQRIPLTSPDEFAGAVDELLDLAAESAEPGSTLARLAGLTAGDRSALVAEQAELRMAAALADEAPPQSRRTQRRDREWDQASRDTAVFYRSPEDPNRFDTGGLTAAVLGLSRDATGHVLLEASGPAKRVPVISATGFAAEPDTDASRAENREWVRGLLLRARGSSLGSDAAAQAQDRAGALEPFVERALEVGQVWGAQLSSERAARVRRLALGTVAARDRLIEVLAAEAGAPAHVIDAEIGGTVDAARYLGQLAEGLGRLRGAEFRPDRLGLVVADEATPLDERAEAVLALLAAGSAVLFVAHPSVARSSAVLLEEWHASGLPDHLVTLLVGSTYGREIELELAERAAADTRVDRALVIGRRSLADALQRRRPDLRIEGRYRVTGATIVAPSADPTEAAQAIVASAFGAGHAGLRNARAAIAVGIAGRTALFTHQLADAVRALRAGDTGHADADPMAIDIGPLPSVPVGAALRALTELGSGESWLVEPRRLDREGRLWSPGVRIGVHADSSFWQDAIGMPVIGVVTTHTLDEAMSIQDRLGGAVAALQATAAGEVVPWLGHARAATLCLGMPTTAGRAERSPSGGWGAAGAGFGALTGGPNRLVTLGSWRPREGTSSSTLHLRGLSPEVQVLIESAQPSLEYAEFDRVRRAALSDALTWRTDFGDAHDVSGLGIERNLLRHFPADTHVRLAEGAPLGDLVRVLAAGFTVGAELTVSTGEVLPPELTTFLASQGIAVSLERDDDWLERLAAAGARSDTGDAGAVAVENDTPTRVRLIGGDRVRAAEWIGRLGRVALWGEPVTTAGPVELLIFLREQAVSIQAHRHGFAALPAGVADWLLELQDRVGAPGSR